MVFEIARLYCKTDMTTDIRVRFDLQVSSHHSLDIISFKTVVH